MRSSFNVLELIDRRDALRPTADGDHEISGFGKVARAGEEIIEVTEIYSYYEGIAKTARKLSDRDAEIEAADFVMRAKRKLGIMMGAARKAGALAKGTRGNFAGQKKGGKPGGVKNPAGTSRRCSMPEWTRTSPKTPAPASGPPNRASAG